MYVRGGLEYTEKNTYCVFLNQMSKRGGWGRRTVAPLSVGLCELIMLVNGGITHLNIKKCPFTTQRYKAGKMEGNKTLIDMHREGFFKRKG